MNDTVTKLMELADEYANPAYWGDPDSRYNARQALQDELTLLFTPLTDEQIAQVWYSCGMPNISTTTKKRVTRAIEDLHGITGEKNETDE